MACNVAYRKKGGSSGESTFRETRNETSKTMTLLELAKERFEDLTENEEKLFSEIQKTGVAVFHEKWENIDPSTADLPELRAECVAWLLTDRKAVELITHRGVTVAGARLNGKLDASFSRFPLQLGLIGCRVPGRVVLLDASFGLLKLSRSHVGGICADRMQVYGDVLLDEGFISDGEVHLLGSSIGGILACRDGKFLNEGGDALSADRVRVSGGVFLDQGFSARGRVRLLGAFIGGNLQCHGGEFHNENGMALCADFMHVSGSAHFEDGFIAHGEMHLLGASIDGSLVFSDSVISNNDDSVLNGERLVVADMFFLGGMEIKGDVELGACSLEKGLRIHDNTWEVDSSLSLRGASVRMLYDTPSGWPAKGELFLNGFSLGSFQDGATMDVADRLAWLDLQPDDEYRPQPYEQLAAVYARAGYEGQAREVLIAKNKRLADFYRRDFLPSFKHGFQKRISRSATESQPPQFGLLAGIWHHLLGLFVGYGYRPQRLLYMALCMVALGWVLFGWGFGREAIVQVQAGAGGHPPFQAFVYSLDTFLPLVDLEQKSRWMLDSRAGWPGGLLVWYQVFHILMGWILTTFAFAALIDRLKR